MKIVKAIYYDPKSGLSSGLDVTNKLTSLIHNGTLIIEPQTGVEIYNKFFTDPFPNKPKELFIKLKIGWKKITLKFKEDQRINLPAELKESDFEKSHFDWNNPWLVSIGGGLIVAILIYIFLPSGTSIINSNSTKKLTYNTTSTVSLSEILQQRGKMSTSLEKQNFLEKFKDGEIYGSGLFVDIYKPNENYSVIISLKEGLVTCSFPLSLEKKLLLFKKNDTVNFTGIFTQSTMFNGGGWFIKDCSLLDE